MPMRCASPLSRDKARKSGYCHRGCTPTSSATSRTPRGPDGTDMAYRPDTEPVHTPNNSIEPVEEARHTAAQISTDEGPMGRPGRLLDPRSPFRVGMLGAAG